MRDVEKFEILVLGSGEEMLIGKDSDHILGFTAFGIEASELLAAVQTAMVGRMPYTMLHETIFTHPTISEGLVFLLGQVESRQRLTPQYTD